MAITPISAPDASGQRGFYNKYPYTDFHELNLDWLLSNYQAIIDKLNDTISWANTHQTEYEEAYARLVVVENEINSFEAEVRAAFAQQKAEIDADFAAQTAALNAALAATEARVNAEIQNMINEVNAAIASFDVRFNQLEREIESQFTRLKIQVNQALVDLDKKMADNNEMIFEYVENTLQQFIDNFPELVDFPVYNPVKGATTGLQEALNDLYSVACVYGLTAIQFDELDMKAEDFDDHDLTVLEFDQYGYNLLDYPDPRYTMFSPFDGQLTWVKTVVQQLAALHTDVDSVSADEYDTLDLTAEEFDAYDITAFNFDWYSKTILI